ncbi:RtcB family protein [Gilliamella sp. B3000]|nr:MULTISPECIES: RtcB family protein [unclassified Gilliamella]MCX8665224.1 RtcB family protein [Gilliamella sp. B2887]MCX8697704.1 RtcB family protein [Gilliamella sp. B3000]
MISPTATRNRFTIKDQIKATAHVECRKDANVINEIPMANKDIDAVMTAQNELVEIVQSIKVLVCVKR